MSDATRATISIMKAAKEEIKVRSSYNVAGFSFSPKEIADEISKHIPGFEMTYNIDYRQQIADSWPKVIDDSAARNDWGWQPEFGLSEMVKDMFDHID